MTTKPIGSIVGGVFGLIFVLTNAWALPAPMAWRILGVLVFLAILWFVVLRGPEMSQEPPSRSAIRTYGFSVTAMVLAIPIGAAVLGNVFDKPDVVLVWVVFIVGAHFLPFSRAFDLSVFNWLSAALMLVAIVGAIVAIPSNSGAAAAGTGVVAGFVLLLFAAIGPRLTQRATART